MCFTDYVNLRFASGNKGDTELVDITTDLESADLFSAYLSIARDQRFGGLLPVGKRWSVLEHSIFVAYLVERLGGSTQAVLGGQIHDLPEGVGLRDLPSPVKEFLRAHDNFAYDELHDAVEAQLHSRWGLRLSAEDEALIHKADRLALRVEQTRMQNVNGREYLESDDEDEIFDELLAEFDRQYERSAALSDVQLAIAFESSLESTADIVSGKLTVQEAMDAASARTLALVARRAPKLAAEKAASDRMADLLYAQPIVALLVERPDDVPF